MIVELTPEAEADLEAAYEWDSDKGIGVSEGFLRVFVACASSIERFPESYPQVFGHFRRSILRRYPYNVYFAPDQSVAFIVGIFHSSRSPRAWRRRIGA